VGVGTTAMTVSFCLSLYILHNLSNFTISANSANLIYLAISAIISFTVITVFLLTGAFRKSRNNEESDVLKEITRLYPLIRLFSGRH
ncbi:MAG: hypothetical protein OXD44_09405, partial [Gammaproteobacteria bacterium]|nr:hypothetical protein [Gammaproteobacteria bacterium]